MFSSITWKDYTDFIICALVAYYMIIGWMFKNDIKQWAITKKIISSQSAVSFSQISTTDKNPGADDTNLAESCIHELNAFFEKAKSRKWVKEELLFALKSILVNYKELKNTSNEEVIQQIVTIQCKAVSSVHISEDDWKQLWLDM